MCEMPDKTLRNAIGWYQLHFTWSVLAFQTCHASVRLPGDAVYASIYVQQAVLILTIDSRLLDIALVTAVEVFYCA